MISNFQLRTASLYQKQSLQCCKDQFKECIFSFWNCDTCCLIFFMMWYLKENISVHYLQQRTIFSRVDELVFLTCYLLSSSSSLPSLFFLTFPPLRGCQKHFFLNCLERWRKRKIKISKLSGVAGLDELLDGLFFFFFWKRGRTCEKL